MQSPVRPSVWKWVNQIQSRGRRKDLDTRYPSPGIKVRRRRSKCRKTNSTATRLGTSPLRRCTWGALFYSPIKPFVGRRLVEVMRHDVLTTRVRISDYFFEEKTVSPSAGEVSDSNIPPGKWNRLGDSLTDSSQVSGHEFYYNENV